MSSDSTRPPENTPAPSGSDTDLAIVLKLRLPVGLRTTPPTTKVSYAIC